MSNGIGRGVEDVMNVAKVIAKLVQTFVMLGYIYITESP